MKHLTASEYSAMMTDLNGGEEFKRAMREVCDEWGLTPREIRSWDRRRDLVHARQLVMLLAEESGVKITEIARRINRDWKTVQHGIARARERMGALQTPVFKSTRTQEGK